MIDLTPAELREFAKVWESDDDAVLNAASERIEEFIREIDKDVLAILSSLALALADAMEERDELRRRLGTAGKVCCDLVEERGKLRADLAAAKIGNVWRCECCGEMATFADSSFRWAGDRWQHSHPEAQTVFDCGNFGPAPILSAAMKVGVEQEERIAQLEADLEAARRELVLAKRRLADAWRSDAEEDLQP